MGTRREPPINMIDTCSRLMYRLTASGITEDSSLPLTADCFVGDGVRVQRRRRRPPNRQSQGGVDAQAADEKPRPHVANAGIFYNEGRNMIRLRQASRVFLLIVVASSLAIALACGGVDDPEAATSTSTTIPVTPTSSSSGGSSSQQEITETALSGLNPGSAVVTIGKKRYEFDMSGTIATQCSTMFGVVGGSGEASDGSDVSLDLEIPPEGYESDPQLAELSAPALRVRDNEKDQDWRAGGENLGDSGVRAGESQVDSYSSDGKSASGTATFIDVNALRFLDRTTNERPQPVQGSFEINCG